ncbi:response regulator [Halomonas elongata]|uniref:Response regulator n=1 Tax=Halomonas elongata (strain ATCC 33173 / DSM 2581 / NBRC 15536 / NCIMB 2198 / 1H9) TaxID=768066 RepID=E1V7G0_HALED|nr:response regulator [Halomonas elongata]MBW5801334.1 response regulator [Halomonas elongata]MDL4864023.1 response regulator [Halomonas elongata]WBF18745.1 response regulator [Halomonas elongata]WPU47601.1 response regulator [Halomonas elongata DSM 2581]CBV41510.1 response regulator/HTH domain transcription regulator [Halomonas elongata DSM 2581]
MRLLVVEDDLLIARSLDNALTPLGNIVEAFTHCAEAGAALRQGGFDLVLLDLGLPDGDGLTLLEAMRERGDTTPVLILTARDGVEDRVRGLDLGADDYLAKPFSIAELEARVRALLRRSQQRSDNQLRLGPLCFDLASGRVTLDETPLELPRRELLLLEGLLSQAGDIAPREMLEGRLFGFGEVGSNALEVYVSRLRKRLQGSGLRIRTFRGLGYRLEEERA